MSEETVKLCIFDDIRKVLDALSGKIDWARHGIRVVGTAMNGQEGLAMIQELKPDLILTDIRMPLMNGLDMTERALAENPLCKVILLSGYTDFEYAQKAIRVGAFDFVAKPFTLEEIAEAANKAKAALLTERRDMMNVQAMERRLKASMPALRQEFLNLLLHHRMDEANVRTRWEFYGIDLDLEHLTALAAEIDEFADRSAGLPIQDIELMRFTLQNILEETISSRTKGIVFRETGGRFVCICNTPPGLDREGLAEACRLNIQKYSKFTISIGFGCSVRRVGELSVSYREAVNAVSHHFYAGGNAVFASSSMEDFDERPPSLPTDREHELLYAFRAGNERQTLEQLRRLFGEHAGGGRRPRPELLTSAFLELAYTLLRVLLEQVPYEEAEPIERRIQECRIGGTVSLQRLRQLLETICVEGCRLTERRRASESVRVINETLLYIKQNLDKDIGMQQCAKLAHLSPSYFSNLFKKVTGQTFSQYVTRTKMERAKELLLAGEQVQWIAGELGYEERRYFSDVFKKHTGLTPTEFKLQYAVSQGGEGGDCEKKPPHSV